MSQYMLGPIVAVIINDNFIGVTEKKLDQYWKLCLVACIGSFWPLFWLWLVPTLKKTRAYRARILVSIEEQKKDEAAEEEIPIHFEEPGPNELK